MAGDHRSTGSEPITVAQIAAELNVAPSTVLVQCHRLGIEATWAGAALRQEDEAVLRQELSPADLPAGSEHVRSRPLPPTAAASSAHLFEPAADAGSPGTPVGPGPGPAPAPIDSSASTSGAGDPEPARPARRPAGGRRLDPALPGAAIGLGVGVALLVLSAFLRSPWAIAALWLVAVVVLLFAALRANRGRYRASTHPERIAGTSLGWCLLGGCALVLAGLGLAVSAVVRQQPAAEAPLGVGDLAAVQRVRWGFHRLLLVEDTGWRSPAKSIDTCWRANADRPATEHRVELFTERLSCGGEPAVEVIDVFAFNRDLDAPYPGPEGFRAEAERRCGDRVTRAGLDGLQVSLVAEFPTEKGWKRADHDVVCLAVPAS